MRSYRQFCRWADLDPFYAVVAIGLAAAAFISCAARGAGPPQCTLPPRHSTLPPDGQNAAYLALRDYALAHPGATVAVYVKAPVPAAHPYAYAVRYDVAFPDVTEPTVVVARAAGGRFDELYRSRLVAAPLLAQPVFQFAPPAFGGDCPGGNCRRP